MLYSSRHGAAHLVANRLGLGARVGDVALYRSDPKGAALGQIGVDLINAKGWGRFDPPAAHAALKTRALISTLPNADQADARSAAQEEGRKVYGQGVGALIASQVASDAGFAERWAGFWSNHLTISASAGPPIRPVLPLYEHEVIRPHCFGRFADLVYASATHAGMLIYLDQARSVGPNSRAGKRRNGAGLNENYARELLELHTLGVNGGYDLDDIQNLAKILTGWTVVAGRQALRLSEREGFEIGQAAFVSHMHEPGRKTVLGKTYGEGAAATRQVIDDLCRTPQAATLISRKLLAHFVGDSATARDEAALSQAFQDSDGDLRVLAAALLNLDSLWRAKSPLIRTPQDYLVALLRATGGRMDRSVLTMGRQFFTDQKQLPWTAPSPQGWSGDLNAWADPNALKARTEFARQFALDFALKNPKIDASTLGEDIIDLSVAPALASALGNAADRAQALGILFAAPQFMWR